MFCLAIIKPFVVPQIFHTGSKEQVKFTVRTNVLLFYYKTTSFSLNITNRQEQTSESNLYSDNQSSAQL